MSGADEGDTLTGVIVGIGASAGGLEALEGLLSTAPSRSGIAYVVVQHLERHALLRVEDTGAGMSDETIARLFQPFMQADATLDRSQGASAWGSRS